MMRTHGNQSGAALLTMLMMLLLVLMLGIAAAQIALQAGKLSRNERDRHIAFTAAEAALLDAEIDIQHSISADKSRSHLFSADSKLGFPVESGNVCASHSSNLYLGLCRSVDSSKKPAWIGINFSDETDAGMHTVPYGRFTGNSFPSGFASMSVKPPRYAIELMDDRSVSDLTGTPAYFYRITAIGFGAREATQVVLQAVYRKPLPTLIKESTIAPAAGRVSWREIINWPELNSKSRN
jgi:type IV pilus assembly protein PilX